MYSEYQLQKQIERMGIKESDTVVIHTSMKAVGDVENGADGLINAFCDYLENGMFIVPTHTWRNVSAENPFYDVRSTVPCIGIVPQIAARREDGFRSLHPTHSVWAFGNGAEEFVSGEEKCVTPTPTYGCWGKLSASKAKILLIGVGNDKNTFIHSVDEEADIKDRLAPNPYNVEVTDKNGKKISCLMRAHYCSKCEDVSRNFPNFEDAFIRIGAQKEGKIGDARVKIVDAALCRKIILQIYNRSEAPEEICVSPKVLFENLYM